MDINETLFALLRTSLWGEERYPFSPPAGTDFDAVCLELRRHAIRDLPVDVLSRAVPDKQTQYIHNALRNISLWYRLMAEQQAVFTLLRDAGIPCAVLKGATADMYYPQPVNRSMGDIDLLVRPRDYDRALALLLENGAEEHPSGDPRHAELRRNNIATELHRGFAKFNDRERTVLLDGWLFDAIDQAEIRTLEGFSFPTLPKKENGLVLLQHINMHLEGGLGLRQIIDWMLYAHRELTDEYWHREFAPAARALGLEKLAAAVTRMCQLYLGLEQSITWCRTAEDGLCRQLMELTMTQGNFGRKVGKQRNRTVSVLSSAKSGVSFFRILQQRGLLNWTAAKRFPLLRPFAWLYQLCRYIRLGLQQEHPLKNLGAAVRRERRQDDLLDRLGVNRMKNSAQDHK